MELSTLGLKDRAQWEAKGYQLPQFDRAAVTEATRENPCWIHFGAGNIFRALIVGTVVMGLVLLMASTLAGLETPLAISAGVTIQKGATLIGNLDRANIITWLFIKLSTIFG